MSINVSFLFLAGHSFFHLLVHLVLTESRRLPACSFHNFTEHYCHLLFHAGQSFFHSFIHLVLKECGQVPANGFHTFTDHTCLVVEGWWEEYLTMVLLIILIWFLRDGG